MVLLICNDCWPVSTQACLDLKMPDVDFGGISAEQVQQGDNAMMQQVDSVAGKAAKKLKNALLCIDRVEHLAMTIPQEVVWERWRSRSVA